MTGKELKLEKILFIDIETAALSRKFDELSPDMKSLWNSKAQNLKRRELSTEEIEDLYIQKAGIYAEFSRVVCISIGYIQLKKNKIKSIRTKSLYNSDETKLLKSFSKLINKSFRSNKVNYICGHNVKEFDIPFLCRRILINEIELPEVFKIQGKKPWEITFILDTLQLWRFGDYKNYCSLDLLAKILNVPSSKTDISGKDIHKYYWFEKDMSSIVKYCEKDVHTTARVFLKLISANPQKV